MRFVSLGEKLVSNPEDRVETGWMKKVFLHMIYSNSSVMAPLISLGSFNPVELNELKY